MRRRKQLRPASVVPRRPLWRAKRERDPGNELSGDGKRPSHKITPLYLRAYKKSSRIWWSLFPFALPLRI